MCYEIQIFQQITITTITINTDSTMAQLNNFIILDLCDKFWGGTWK